MPELPEVENVKLSLRAQGLPGQVFTAVEFLRANLRTPLPKALLTKLPGQTLRRIERRAKFLLFETEDLIILSHLGMTGSWRLAKIEDVRKHDHVVFEFRSGLRLVFNDPRRFGLLELVDAKAPSRWLKNLGPEPLDPEFTAEHLFTKTRGIKSPIKAFLMDQRRVVGVGNIYASEALFGAGVRPTRAARRLTRAEAVRLVETIQSVLKRAIQAGGSTIRDYRNSHGESGSFQQQFKVYGRKGEACGVCGATIRAKTVGGRNTFWCVQCQS